jgi:hypothetical protein
VLIGSIVSQSLVYASIWMESRRCFRSGSICVTNYILWDEYSLKTWNLGVCSRLLDCALSCISVACFLIATRQGYWNSLRCLS